MIQQFTFTVRGYVPSKKNNYSRGKGGNIFIDGEMRNQLSSLEWQFRKQWGKRLPAIHPKTVFRLVTGSDGRDRDNWEQTLLDCMVRAGVLADDNIRKFNGWSATAPAVVDKKLEKQDECSIVSMEWDDGQ